MMTPQEVSSHAFSKATLGGYNMVKVDAFLDMLTEDYTSLYNDNAILKNKLKLLSDTVEEYRATDEAMRKTLLAAKQMADAMVKDAEAKRDSLIKDAEAAAQQRIDELKAEIAAEEYRLKTAKETTAAYAAKVGKLYEAQALLLKELDKLAPAGQTSEIKVENTAQAIEDNLAPILEKEASGTPAAPEQPKEQEPVHTPAGTGTAEHREPRREQTLSEMESTRRFDDLQFGKDYVIR